MLGGSQLGVPRDVSTEIAGKGTFERPGTYPGTTGPGSAAASIERWSAETGQRNRTGVSGPAQPRWRRDPG